jgi:hypothetical protein
MNVPEFTRGEARRPWRHETPHWCHERDVCPYDHSGAVGVGCLDCDGGDLG